MGSAVVYAMTWSLRRDLNSMPINATGRVNPAGVSFLAVESHGLLTNAAS
jgi:hypothetical protein